MAKLRLRVDISSAEKALRECKRIAAKKSQLQPIADLAAELIVTRTALGKGADTDGGTPVKLAPLSESYKAVRGKKVRFLTNKKTKKIFAAPGKTVNLSSLTSPGKSNLTATRQMLDSIYGQASDGRIEVTVDDARGPDLLGNSSSVTNSELIAIHERGATISHPSGTTMKIPARPFFHLTKDQLDRLGREFRKVLEACLRQFR